VTQAETLAVPDEDPAPDHDVKAVLRIPPYRQLLWAMGLSSLGDWLGLLATAALAGHLAGDSFAAQNLAIAAVFILRLAPAIVLGPIAGALADRFDRRRTLVIGDVIRFVLFASIALSGNLTWLFVATVLVECVALFWGPAHDATLPNMVPRRRLEAANQLNLVATYGTAPVAAGLYAGLAVLCDGLAAISGMPDPDPVTVALWVNALTFLVSAVVIARLDFPPQAERTTAVREAGVLSSILQGWHFVVTTRMARGLVLGMLGAFAAGGFVIGLAQTLVRDLGAGEAGFGVLFGAVFVGLALGMWMGPMVLRSFSRRRLFGLALVAGGVSLIGLALMRDLVMVVIFTVVVGVCGGIAWVTGYTLLGLEIEDEVRGRTFAFLHSAARVVLVLVLAAGPAAAAAIDKYALPTLGLQNLPYSGAAYVFVLSGLIAVAMGLTSYRLMDDRPGARLHTELARAWSNRPEAPRTVSSKHSGYFVAFEGGDGSGKSTQARMLAEWLREDQGHDVVLTREPGATAVGIRLRELLLGGTEQLGARTEALLFAADRAHHVNTLVEPALARGAIVVTDRYVDSSIAYQGAGRALESDEIDYISRWATGGLAPDLVVLIDVPPEISKGRRARDPQRDGDDALERLPEEFHERVRGAFLALARRDPDRYLVLDGCLSREEIHQAVRARVRDLVPISRKRRAELVARLAAEEDARVRRAAAEAEVLRLDAELRGRNRDEARARQQAQVRAQAEAERQLREEAERQLREEAARQLREDAEHRFREEAEIRFREEAERQLREEAEQHERDEAARRESELADQRERELERQQADRLLRESTEQREAVTASSEPNRKPRPRQHPPRHPALTETSAERSPEVVWANGDHALSMPRRTWFSADPSPAEESDRGLYSSTYPPTGETAAVRRRPAPPRPTMPPPAAQPPPVPQAPPQPAPPSMPQPPQPIAQAPNSPTALPSSPIFSAPRPAPRLPTAAEAPVTEPLPLLEQTMLQEAVRDQPEPEHGAPADDGSGDASCHDPVIDLPRATQRPPAQPRRSTE